MRYLSTRRVIAGMLAAAGITGSLGLAMAQNQGPPSGPVPTPMSSPHDITPKTRPPIPQDTINTPINTPAPPQPQNSPPGSPK
jgi:hypothetical protein